MKLHCTVQRDAKLLSILRRELALSGGLVKRLKYRGAFTVNGTPVHTDFPVKCGDVVDVELAEDVPDYPPEYDEIHILYEDEALLAVDKPAGMLVHPSFSRNTGTLANRLLGYYERTGQPCAVHPVSRLDRDTFGVVLLAKNAHVHAKLCEMSKNREIEKVYHALVFGCPPASEGIIDAPIARVSETSLLRCVRQDGKPARSQYRVLEASAHASLLELRPLTGRTHQLRVHCAYLGCPMLGDPQYGSEASRAFSEAHGLTYQQLCAARLRFLHPLREKIVEIRSDFAVTLDFLSPADI